MPTTRTSLFYTIIPAMTLTGFVLYSEPPAAQQAAPEHQASAAQLWVAKSIAELEPKAQTQTAAYDECAARLQADYDDDPARAYGWMRTLCRY
jgi:hypothetical protein